MAHLGTSWHILAHLGTSWHILAPLEYVRMFLDCGSSCHLRLSGPVGRQNHRLCSPQSVVFLRTGNDKAWYISKKLGMDVQLQIKKNHSSTHLMNVNHYAQTQWKITSFNPSFGQCLWGCSRSGDNLLWSKILQRQRGRRRRDEGCRLLEKALMRNAFVLAVRRMEKRDV